MESELMQVSLSKIWHWLRRALVLGNLVIGCIYDALHGEKKDYFSKAFQIPEGYSFQIALAVGHKTDHKTPHEYDFDKQVTIM